jgi:ABC-type Fe3+-hydroxamate transport system substrate-binding protein
MTGRGIPTTRREVIGGVLSAVATAAVAGANAPRVAVIDWALLETVLALGVVPIAATELIQFRRLVMEPEVPEAVVDLGLRGSPNYELLRIVAPDLILISNFYEPSRHQFERIARVVSLPVYQTGRPPFPLAARAITALGDKLGKREAARRYLEDTEGEIGRLRNALSLDRERRAFVVLIGDQRHVQAFGPDSMFGEVLTRLGVVNAWTHATRYSAAAPVGFQALASDPGADIFIVGPLPPDFERTRDANVLWQTLPAVREGRVAILPSVNNFGGLPAARRFARLFTDAALALDRSRDD